MTERKNAFTQSMAVYYILEVVLIWSNEDTTSGTVPATGVIILEIVMV